MDGNTEVLKNRSDEEIYEQVNSALGSLLKSDEPIISNLSNFTALLKQAFDKISWIGFYIFKDEALWLGPFQGKLACTMILPGKGVCGTAFVNEETIIVEDVNSFAGHIACDVDSKSEIVVPIFVDEKVWGVLDIDSTGFSSFNEIDKENLESMCKFLSIRLDLKENLI